MNGSFPIFQLSEEHDEIRAAVRAVAENKIGPYAAEVDADMRYPQEAHDALVAADFFAPHVGEEYDGVGADALHLHRDRGDRAGLSVVVADPRGQQAGQHAADPRWRRPAQDDVPHAPRPRRERILLRPLRAGRRQRPASMKTRAVRDGDDWVLNGQKSWITNVGISEFYTVLAVTDPDGARGSNVSAFIVEKSDEGFTFGEKERKLGIKGSPTRELLFDNVRIPGDRMIGAPGSGLKLALRTLDHARVTIGAQAVGIAQGALDFAVGYVKDRRQFGKPIAEFQGIQFMLADMAMKLEAARQMVYVAAAKSERDDPDLGFFGAAAKCFASDAAMEITTDAVQLLGGYGYTQDFPVERMMRDAKITQIYEGTNQVQRIVMARAVLYGIDSPR